MQAREYVFWTNYTKDIETIEKYAKRFLILQTPRNSSMFLQFHYILGTHWEQIYSIKRNKISWFWLTTSANFYSSENSNSTSSTVIKELGQIFAEFGKPFILRSNNGPFYISAGFQFFLKEWNVKLITSSPSYHQSNGLAESMMKTYKTLIEKKQFIQGNHIHTQYKIQKTISTEEIETGLSQEKWNFQMQQTM